MANNPYALPARKMNLGQGIIRYEFAPKSRMPDGNYRVFGGLAWPGVGDYGDEPGLALVMALEVGARIMHIMAEHEYAIIDPMAVREGIEPFPYLADWLSRAWSDYGCGNFYWAGRENECAGMVRRVRDSAQISPQPKLILVNWLDNESAERTWREWDQGGRLRFLNEGRVHRAMKVWLAKRTMNRGVWALAAALAAADLAGAAKIKREGEAERGRQPIKSWKGLV